MLDNRVIQLHSQNWSSKKKGLKNSGSDSRRIKRLKDNSCCTDQMYMLKLIQRPAVKITTNDAPPSMTASHFIPHNACLIVEQQSLSCLLPCNQINQWCGLNSLFKKKVFWNGTQRAHLKGLIIPFTLVLNKCASVCSRLPKFTLHM